MIWAKYRRHAAWLALPAFMMAFLSWREGQARVQGQTQMPEVVASAPAQAQGSLPVTALALAFGFKDADAKVSARSDMVLKACFVSSLGEARALISNNSKDAIYRVGDRLAGGGVVRRIDSRAITLWVDGQEETLALAGASGNLLRPVSRDAPVQPAATSSLLLLRNPQ